MRLAVARDAARDTSVRLASARVVVDAASLFAQTSNADGAASVRVAENVLGAAGVVRPAIRELAIRQPPLLTFASVLVSPCLPCPLGAMP